MSGFYLIYKQNTQIDLNIGCKQDGCFVFAVQGEDVPQLVSLLNRYAVLHYVEHDNEKTVYAIRPDDAPMIGGFLLSLRNTKKWRKQLKILESILRGEHKELERTLHYFLQIYLSLPDNERALNVVSELALQYIEKLAS